MTRLPADWRMLSLGDIGTEVQTGFASGANNRSGHGVVHLRPMNVTRAGRLDLADVKFVEDQSDRRVVSGDVLFNNTNSPALVGKTAFVEVAEPLAYSNHMTRLRFPADAMDPRFVAHQLHYLWMTGFFERICSNHVNQASVAAKRLLAVEVAVPPLDEQRRIVAILEDHLSRLEVASNSLRKAQSYVSRMREAWLARLCRDVDLPVVPLVDLLREPVRNGHSARASRDGSGVRTLTLTAVTKRDFSAENTKMTVADPVRVRNLWLEPGDIFIERSNTADLVGTSAMYTGPGDWAIFPDLLIRVRPDSERLLPDYLDVLLRTPSVRGYFRSRAKGLAGSMPKIDHSSVESLPVPLPGIDQQRRLCAEFSEFEAEASRLTASVRTGIDRGDILGRALLAAAFSGQLTRESVGV